MAKTRQDCTQNSRGQKRKDNTMAKTRYKKSSLQPRQDLSKTRQIYVQDKTIAKTKQGMPKTRHTRNLQLRRVAFTYTILVQHKEKCLSHSHSH